MSRAFIFKSGGYNTPKCAFKFQGGLGKIKCVLRQKPAIRGDICSESPPKVCEIDMAQGEDMSKGPGTEEIMFLSA